MVRSVPTRLVRTAIEREQVRYIFIGGICAVINNVVLIGGNRLGYSYVWLTVLSSFISGSIAYGLHAHYSFRRRKTWRAYGQFLCGTSVGIPLAVVTLAVLVTLLGLPMWIASPTSTVMMMLYNYGFARLAIVGRLISHR
ncbi:GtrA family protein [Novosphingobium sp. FSW06-99]|uniref:GtrA family protein n=1 Tax=Novosphingobium sp. FSW06-99 TaxID=1739113 RepID=UPI000A92A3A7|nr:GtrA family protein [Novosphingobium sp. FSW06-99]